ncbi:hypothetical protein IWX90DRAFT_418456 [Phyllosticta citrichinensis]|uniref:Uncharacterized protein n=1 Tax=Phyllosticta citrichinensis TaxID=1130410 RepID=A0ABR1XJ46_9PEZI
MWDGVRCGGRRAEVLVHVRGVEGGKKLASPFSRANGIEQKSGTPPADDGWSSSFGEMIGQRFNITGTCSFDVVDTVADAFVVYRPKPRFQYKKTASMLQVSSMQQQTGPRRRKRAQADSARLMRMFSSCPLQHAYNTMKNEQKGNMTEEALRSGMPADTTEWKLHVAKISGTPDFVKNGFGFLLLLAWACFALAGISTTRMDSLFYPAR